MLYKRFVKKGKPSLFLPVLIPVMNLFLLLLPFVLETAFLQKLTTIELSLPSFGTTPSDIKQHSLIIELHKDVVYIYFDGNKVSDIKKDENFSKRFEEKLRNIKNVVPTLTTVQLKSSPDVIYQDLIDVIDVCKKGNNLFPEVVLIDEVK